MRIVFMGTASFGIPSLNVLAQHHEVVAVVTAPDRPKGRGRSVQCSPVKGAADSLGIPVLCPEKLSDPEFVEELRALNADLFYVVAFRILPSSVFTIPPKGTVNLHGSLLPDYRGAAPVNWAVINGDRRTGLTTFFIDEKIDTGDILLKTETDIDPNETAGELYERLCSLGTELTRQTVDGIAAGTLTAVRQPEGKMRPAPKLFKPHGLINWTLDAQTVHNHIRGMNPVPGSYTACTAGNVKIHRTEMIENETPGNPGMIMEVSGRDGIVVSCGRGKLRILEIQPPGKKRMDAASFVRGYRIEAGIDICAI